MGRTSLNVDVVLGLRVQEKPQSVAENGEEEKDGLALMLLVTLRMRGVILAGIA